MKEDEMDQACGMHGEEKCIQGLGGETRRKENILET
jgi:hypothetical protein